EDASLPASFEPPFICLVASGGHTLLVQVHEHDGFEVLGRTLDDAAPAALAFPGPRAERAKGGRGSQREASARSLDFSFAGLKTALLYKLRELPAEQVEAQAADLAASYQAAIVDSLLDRVVRALEQSGSQRLAVGGGVAANGALRERLGELGVTLRVPARVLCTDNAAMIASAARYSKQLAYPDYLGLDAYATGERAR